MLSRLVSVFCFGCWTEEWKQTLQETESTDTLNISTEQATFFLFSSLPITPVFPSLHTLLQQWSLACFSQRNHKTRLQNLSHYHPHHPHSNSNNRYRKIHLPHKPRRGDQPHRHRHIFNCVRHHPQYMVHTQQEVLHLQRSLASQSMILLLRCLLLNNQNQARMLML